MDAIFLDTNSIANKSTNAFFGQIEKFERLANVAQIYIPSIVIEEIKQQKVRELESKLSSFKENYFTKYLDCDVSSLDDHITEKIEELYQQATDEVDHIELALEKDLEHVDALKIWALKNHPPFEKGSDKGFKDAYIYLIIQQFLEKNTTHDVFLFTKDGRLKEAFQKNERVTVLLEPDEYFSYREEYFKGEYFLDVLRQGFSEMDEIEEEVSLTVENIKEINLTEDDDWQIFVDLEDQGSFEVLVDFASKEIISGRAL